MNFPRPIPLLIACALLWCAGCGDRRRSVEGELRDIGGPQLRHDAAVLCKELFSAHGHLDYILVTAKNRPASFQRLAPIQVGAYVDGISISLKTSSVGEEGLFVVPESMDHEPVAARGISYQQLEPGIYWYTFSGGKP